MFDKNSQDYYNYCDDPTLGSILYQLNQNFYNNDQQSQANFGNNNSYFNQQQILGRSRRR